MIKLKSLFNEEFFDSFEANRVGTSNYVEIFKNPSSKELKECISDNEFPLILVGDDSYIWDRDKALHYETMCKIGNKISHMMPLMIYGSKTAFGIYITEATRYTKWYRNPDAQYFIRKHPFFKNKTIEEITYWDADINGEWI